MKGRGERKINKRKNDRKIDEKTITDLFSPIACVFQGGKKNRNPKNMKNERKLE